MYFSNHNDYVRRSLVFVIALVLLSSLNILSAYISAQTDTNAPTTEQAENRPPDIRALEAGQVVEREIKGDEAHYYTLRLTQGEFFQVEVAPRGVNLGLVLMEINGQEVKLSKATRIHNLRERSRLSYEVKKAGDYVFTVKAFKSVREVKKARGHGFGFRVFRIPMTQGYQIRRRDSKATTESDRKTILAEDLFEKSLQLFREGTRKSKLAAVMKLEEVKDIWIELKEHYYLAQSLNSLGQVLSSLGEARKALERFKRALSVQETIPDEALNVAILNNIGMVYSDLSEKQKALDYFFLALPQAEDNASLHTILNNIGFVYSDLGEKQQALFYFKLALPHEKDLDDEALEPTTLNNIGAVYASVRDKQTALDYYNRALTLQRRLEDKTGEARTLNNIGLVYLDSGEQQTALDYYNQALTLRRTIGDKAGESITLINIGAAYSKIGKKQAALDYYNLALILTRVVGDKAGEAATLNNVMLEWMDLGNPRMAVFFGKQAVNRFQELRGTIQGLDKKTQSTYLQTVAGCYRALAELLIEQGRLPEAQFVLSMLKDEEFFKFVRRDPEEIAALAKSIGLSKGERKAFAEYARLADELTAIGAKYQTLFDKRSHLGGEPLPDAAEEAEFIKLSKDLSGTSATFQRFLQHLAKEFAKARQAAKLKIERIKELQADLREIGSDVVLVSTVVLPNRYRVIITTGQTQIDRKTEIKEAALNHKLNCFLMALKNPLVDPRPLGKELYDILVKPLEKDLAKGKIKTILWSLDGALRYVPVAALWDGEHYLAERYQNVIITLGHNSRLFREVNRDWRALGAGVSTKWPGFAELRAVPRELRSIIRDERNATETEGVLPGQRLLDAEFVADRFKDLLPIQKQGRRFNIIHLASHFKLGQDPDTSFLLLGDGAQLSLAEFGNDLRLQPTGVELLTLSACETGVGIEKGDGSEFESFGMIAEQNGAKAVIATLWKVADCSTGEFMREFYRLHQQAQQQGMTKAVALQLAQQAMLYGAIKEPAECPIGTNGTGTTPDACALPPFSPNPAKPFAHPYYWAPFILIGNWR